MPTSDPLESTNWELRCAECGQAFGYDPFHLVEEHYAHEHPLVDPEAISLHLAWIGLGEDPTPGRTRLKLQE